MDLKNAEKKIKVNEVDYIRADIHECAFNEDELPYVIVRSSDSGVHIGYLQYREGSEVSLVNSRRIYYWEGAATLSQLSQDGVSRPNECKIPCVVPHITVLGVCEIIPASPKCKASIEDVPVWEV